MSETQTAGQAPISIENRLMDAVLNGGAMVDGALEQSDQDQPTNANPNPEQSEGSDEDRLLAALEGEDQEVAGQDQEEGAQGEESAEGEEPKIALTLDGKEVELTVTEAVSKLEAAHANSAQVQAFEAEKKAFEPMKAATLRDQANYQAALSQIAAVLNAFTPAEPDPTMINSDPEGYYRAKNTRDMVLKQLAVISDQQQQETAKSHAEQAQQAQQRALTFRTQTRDLIPAWKDNAVLQKEVPEFEKFLIDQFGYTQAQIASASDARDLKAHYDSWELHRLKARSKDLKTGKRPVKQQNRAAPTLRAGNGQFTPKAGSQFNKARAQLKSTGKVADAEALFEQMFAPSK